MRKIFRHNSPPAADGTLADLLSLTAVSRHDPSLVNTSGPRMFCDLTQSWSQVGGGVRTYLVHKRRHILDRTPHSHLLMVPGECDAVVQDERTITVTIASPRVPGSPNYRLMLRNGAVRAALERYRPDLIECQDAYNLPWAAIAHRRRYPETALIAAYMTDFPTVYLERPLARSIAMPLAGPLSRLAYAYCKILYSRFDALFALSENGGAAKLRSIGIDPVHIVPLGVELGEFGPERRDGTLRTKLAVGKHQPLIVYVGRLDSEKKVEVLVGAFRRLPDSLGAKLVLLGEGPLKAEIEGLGDPRILLPGYISSRADLARWLASADIYASAMADETFGVSVIEAQASGLPVVGVAAGAMLDRVTEEVGRLGPVDDAEAMAANILAVWKGDRPAMAAAARAHALRFSWASSMETLFGHVYPAAFERRRVRQLARNGVAVAAA